MKKLTILFLGVLVSYGATAQKQVNSNKNSDPNQAPAKDHFYTDFDNTQIQKQHQSYNPAISNKGKTATTVRWSEDFANGFTNSTNGAWTTGGTNANLVTVDMNGPDSLLQFGWGPIPSPTASNGFAIMDWYRKIPDIGGFASSPAQGLLTSPTINLGTNSDVFLSFYQQLFWCCNLQQEVFVEISTDGGTTWPTRFKTNVTDRNGRHWNLGYGYYFEYDISAAVAANPANVKIRFNWTSLTADANGQYSNVYFWMIDDIKISDLPRHKAMFTEYQGAPAHDIIFDGDGSNSKTGHFTSAENHAITFDGNVYNFGADDQTGVDLKVEFFDDAGNPAGSVQSNNSSVLLKGDTLDFNVLTTAPWTPPGNGEYTFVYTVISDSIPISPNAEMARDSFELEQSDSITSLDFGVFGNSIGTVELGDDGSAIASRFTYTAKKGIDVYGLIIDYSTATVAGGNIQIEIYDTTGFSFTGGFAGSPLISQAFNVGTDADNGDFVRYDLTDANGDPLQLQNGTYYFVVYMFSNSGVNRVAIANNHSFTVTDASSIMYNTTNSRWFTSYVDSKNFNSPIVRAVTAPNSISLDEIKQPNMVLYPNPSSGKFQVELDKGGAFTIHLTDMKGQTVHTQSIDINGNEKINLDYSTFTKGVYLLKITGSDEYTRTARVVIR